MHDSRMSVCGWVCLCVSFPSNRCLSGWGKKMSTIWNADWKSSSTACYLAFSKLLTPQKKFWQVFFFRLAFVFYPSNEEHWPETSNSFGKLDFQAVTLTSSINWCVSLKSELNFSISFSRSMYTIQHLDVSFEKRPKIACFSLITFEMIHSKRKHWW